MKLRLLAVLCALIAPLALAQSHADHVPERMKIWRAILAKPSLAVAVAFDESVKGGRLWRVAAQDGYLLASHSDDLGRNFSTPVRVNAAQEAILGDGENRPKLVVKQGVLYVSWTRGLAGPMTGDIRFSRSLDGGKSFTVPLTINDNRDIISHRFESLVADAQGRVALAWLDKRDLQAAQRAGQPYVGAAVYVAESRDGGRSFATNRKLADHSCECCRVALAQDIDGMPVALWRHVYTGDGNNQIRDFAIARFDASPDPSPARASDDGWQLNGCPHHGGDLAIDARGGRHLAWFTGAAGKAGLWYRRIDGAQAQPAMPFGDTERQPGHAGILVSGDTVFLAWQEYDGRMLTIRTMHSTDRGERWSAPVTQATTAHAADYPQLLSGRGQVWLAWNSADEGLRLFPIFALGTAP